MGKDREAFYARNLPLVAFSRLSLALVFEYGIPSNYFQKLSTNVKNRSGDIFSETITVRLAEHLST